MDIYTESSGIDTSPDMNSSSDLPEDFPSPDRMAILKPRTLTYDETDDMPVIKHLNNNNKLNHNNNNNNNNRNKFMEDDDDGLLHQPHFNRSLAMNMSTLRPSSLLQASKLNLESPPYRKVRSLRLFDTPATPKTIIEKSTASDLSSASLKYTTKPLAQATPNLPDRPRAYPIHNKVLDTVTANINPFSPSSKF